MLYKHYINMSNKYVCPINMSDKEYNFVNIVNWKYFIHLFDTVVAEINVSQCENNDTALFWPWCYTKNYTIETTEKKEAYDIMFYILIIWNGYEFISRLIYIHNIFKIWKNIFILNK